MRALLRWILILACLLVALALVPAVWAWWIARGDPDIRLDQHRDYLAALSSSAGPAAPNIVLVFADDLG